MKTPLYERIKKMEKKYSPKKLRKALKLFVKLTKLEESDLKNLIEEYRKGVFSNLDRNLKEYAGLAQSILYTMIKQKTNNWEVAYKSIGKKFDLPYGGSYITADKDYELTFAKFTGAYSGKCVEFSGRGAGIGAEFLGEFSGKNSEFSGYEAGMFAEFSEEKSKLSIKFSGTYAGKGAIFLIEEKNKTTNFLRKSSGIIIKFPNKKK